MVDELVRTVCLKLHPDKPDLLDELRKDFREAWNQYINHIKDLGSTNKQQLEEKEVEHNLLQNTRQCARDKARESVKSFFEIKKFDDEATFPSPKNRPMTAKLNYREGYVFRDDLTVRISVRAGDRVYSEISGSKEDIGYIKKALDGEYSFGTAEVVKKSGEYYLHVHIETEDVPSVDDNEDNTYIGIDVNEGNIVATAINTDGEVLRTLMLDYSPLKKMKHKYFTIRKRLMDNDRKPKEFDKEGCKTNNLIHKISRIIVEFAQEFKTPILCLEELTHIRKEIKYSKKMNRRLHSWNFAKLGKYIKYKAEWDGILVQKIDPEHTSQTCPVCGNTEKKNKNGRRFKCQDCGHQDHRDRNASLNIGLKGMKKLLGNVPSLKNFPSFKRVRWMASGLVNRPSGDIIQMSCLSSGSPSALPSG